MGKNLNAVSLTIPQCCHPLRSHAVTLAMVTSSGCTINEALSTGKAGWSYACVSNNPLMRLLELAIRLFCATGIGFEMTRRFGSRHALRYHGDGKTLHPVEHLNHARSIFSLVIKTGILVFLSQRICAVIAFLFGHRH